MRRGVCNTNSFNRILVSIGVAILPSIDPFPNVQISQGDAVAFRPTANANRRIEPDAMRHRCWVGPRPQRCRDDDFKLAEIHHDRHLEMFNVKEDPGETRNLIARFRVKEAVKWRMSPEIYQGRVLPGSWVQKAASLDGTDAF
jgi:hypothetical protein